MKYEVKIGSPTSDFSRVIVVEAPDELTAAYRAGLPARQRDFTTLEVLATRSEADFHRDWPGDEE